MARVSLAEVEAFVEMCAKLIDAAGEYAFGGVYDEESNGIMQRVKVSANALQSALSAVNIPKPMTFPPPPTPPELPEVPEPEINVKAVPTPKAKVPSR